MLINAWLIKSRKSAANLTFSKWKQETTGRQKRGKGLSNASQSVTDHQLAMKMLVDLFKDTAAAVKIGYKQFNSTIGNYAAWIRANMDTGIIFTVPGDPTFNYDFMQWANGSMPTTTPTSVVADASANSITVNYPTTIGYGQNASDRIRAVIYGENTGFIAYATSTAERGDGTAVFAVPAGELVVADDIIVWTFFEGQPSTPTAGKVSDQNKTIATVVA